MITDGDIIRVLSDPRMERTVLAIVRRALYKNKDEEEEHESASDQQLPAEWGWIPLTKAANKYKMAEVDIADAIRKNHVRGNDKLVDEDTLRLFVYNGEPHNTGRRVDRVPERETELRIDANLHQGAPARIEPAYEVSEAAAMLNLPEERVLEHIIAGTLRDNGDGKPTKASVHKHRSVLAQLPERTAAAPLPGEQALVSQVEPAVPAATEQPVDTMTTAAAATYLDIQPAYASQLASAGILIKSGWGRVTRASVEAHKATWAQNFKVRAVKQSGIPGLITNQEACNRYGFPLSSLKNWLHTGKVAKAAKGYVRPEDVESYMTARGMRIPEQVAA